MNFALSIPVSVFARVPDDPLYHRQWYLETIGAPAAWDTTVGRRDVVVAVLDSGVDLDHPDLVGNLWTNVREVAGNGRDDDNNGYVDDVGGWDFVDGDNTPEPDAGEPYSEDGVAHGTVIAGLIGAVGDNGEGVAGVAWHIRIMPVRILDNFGSGESGDARRAVEYAIDNGADVINLSFTGFEIDQALEFAVNQAYAANIPVVAAVGNADGGIDLNETPVYPACFTGEKTDWVIGVAATTEDDTRADFSNYGSNCVELSAPGDDLFGVMYQNESWEAFSELYIGGWSGTSVAAPIVTGAIALLKSAYPSLTSSAIRNVLQLSVDPIVASGVGDGQMGAGRLNIARALEIAPSFVSTAETAVTGISPVTGLPEALNTVLPGSFIRSPSFETVYFIDAEMRRHPLWDAQTYFTWNNTWDNITWVTDATLPTLPLADVLPPKPGVVLVKIQSDPNVYAVEPGGTPFRPTLRSIPTEQIARDLYGPLWNAYVIDVEPTLFSHYRVGDPMTGNETVDRSILKTRESL